jgi:opacity protein-like surface antigen
MKRFVALMAMLVLTAGLSFAADWVGYVADAKCAAGGKAASAGHAGCAQNCVKAGQPIAFVVEADGKVYKIKNQDAVAAHVGHKVTLTGQLDGDAIQVDKVAM